MAGFCNVFHVILCVIIYISYFLSLSTSTDWIRKYRCVIRIIVSASSALYISGLNFLSIEIKARIKGLVYGSSWMLCLDWYEVKIKN